MVNDKGIKGKDVIDPFVIQQTSNLISRYYQILNQIDCSSWTASEVVSYLTTSTEDLSFSDYARNHIKKLISRGQERTSRNYKWALNHLERFAETDNIMFSRMTSAYLNRWIESLSETNGCKERQFSGVKNYFVMVGKKSKDLEERVGYYGERLVLLVQTLGLNTCWVGLSYRKVPEAYNVCKDEKLACMIALGYGETQGVSHKIKTIQQVSNASDLTPAWFKTGVEAALLAPTAVNQQKFYFEYVGMKNNQHIIKAKKGFSMVGFTQMDLGIAKCHFDVTVGKGNFDWI